MGFMEGMVVAFVSLIIGVHLGYMLAKKTSIMSKISKDEREKMKVINNPDLLLEKLKESADKTYDDGKGISYRIEEIDGKRVVVEERKSHQIPEGNKKKHHHFKEGEKKKNKNKHKDHGKESKS